MTQAAVNTKKHAGGRPTKYRPEFCEKVVELGKQGKTFAQIALALDIDKENMRDWADKRPEFRRALTRGEAFCEAWWINFAQENLITSRAVSFNDRAWMNIMMNKFGWNKKTEETVKGDLADALQKIAEQQLRAANKPESKDSQI